MQENRPTPRAQYCEISGHSRQGDNLKNFKGDKTGHAKNSYQNDFSIVIVEARVQFRIKCEVE